MSAVLDRLAQSDDRLENELSRILRNWQVSKVDRGEKAQLGYEPRDINKLGAVEVISRRVKNGADGFDDVSPSNSYESIVCKFPKRFSDEIVKIAKRRIENAKKKLRSSVSTGKTSTVVTASRTNGNSNVPKGNNKPKTVIIKVESFIRDPEVKAYVLGLAGGRCELCESKAPFVDESGKPYLEVHHVKHLAEKGTDTVSNSVALCPNCHRGMHHSTKRKSQIKKLFKRLSRLVPE